MTPTAPDCGDASPETKIRAVADALRIGFDSGAPLAMPLQMILVEAYKPDVPAWDTSLCGSRYGFMQRAAKPEVLCPQLSDFEPKQIGGSIGVTSGSLGRSQ